MALTTKGRIQINPETYRRHLNGVMGIAIRIRRIDVGLVERVMSGEAGLELSHTDTVEPMPWIRGMAGPIPLAEEVTIQRKVVEAVNKLKAEIQTIIAEHRIEERIQSDRQ